jgi:nucleotide-binding universal stress UspA family protein
LDVCVGAGANHVLLNGAEVLGDKARTLCPDKNPAVIRVATGHAAVEISRQAREEAADLVVVGDHGTDSVVKGIFSGTTAERTLRESDRPILVVKGKPCGSYRRVGVAVDFSEASRQALELAIRLAPGANFNIVHAYHGFAGWLRGVGSSEAEIIRYRCELTKYAREEMELFLSGVEHAGKRIRRLLNHGRAPGVIVHAARRLRVDLVALGATARRPVTEIFLGSVAKYVLREVSCDVLVVPPSGRSSVGPASEFVSSA